MDSAILPAKTDSMPPHKMEFCGQILREKVAKPFRAGSSKVGFILLQPVRAPAHPVEQPYPALLFLCPFVFLVAILPPPD